jgi:hypothetical protein
VKTISSSAPAGGVDSPSLKACASGAVVRSPKSGRPSLSSAKGCRPSRLLRLPEEDFLVSFAASDSR